MVALRGASPAAYLNHKTLLQSQVISWLLALLWIHRSLIAAAKPLQSLSNTLTNRSDCCQVVKKLKLEVTEQEASLQKSMIRVTLVKLIDLCAQQMDLKFPFILRFININTFWNIFT